VSGLPTKPLENPARDASLLLASCWKHIAAIDLHSINLNMYWWHTEDSENAQ
jgi:hypothetical protein